MINLTCDVCGWTYTVAPGGRCPDHDCGNISANRKPNSCRFVLGYHLKTDQWVITHIHANGEWEDDITFWRELPARPGGCIN